MNACSLHEEQEQLKVKHSFHEHMDTFSPHEDMHAGSRFTNCNNVIEQPGILASPRSLSAQDPSQPMIPVNPRSQSAQDPSQPTNPSAMQY